MRLLSVLAMTCMAAGLALSPVAAEAGSKGPRRPAAPSTASALDPSTWTVQRAASPARTLVRDGTGRLLATFTDGSRSAVLSGPVRTFSEPSVTATVTTSSWVRLLPRPATPELDVAWLSAALADRTPDVLQTALQYVAGAPDVRDRDGTLLAADAAYGPLVDGARQEGADWNDFLQVTADYDGVADRPEASQVRALDCSGYVRMVFGRRSGFPMVLAPDGVRLPRRAVQMHTAAPGTLIADSTGRPTDLAGLLAGDLVLFDASTDDGTAVDHVGIYLGTDAAGSRRFISSRKTVDGPTMGDLAGRSTLDGTGLYAKSLRAVRRL